MVTLVYLMFFLPSASYGKFDLPCELLVHSGGRFVQSALA